MSEKQKSQELQEEKLENAAGGVTDYTFDDIMQAINDGRDYWAYQLFNLLRYSLEPRDAYTIRMTFLQKFGYPIDMYEDKHEVKE